VEKKEVEDEGYRAVKSMVRVLVSQPGSPKFGPQPGRRSCICLGHSVDTIQFLDHSCI